MSHKPDAHQGAKTDGKVTTKTKKDEASTNRDVNIIAKANNKDLKLSNSEDVSNTIRQARENVLVQIHREQSGIIPSLMSINTTQCSLRTGTIPTVNKQKYILPNPSSSYIDAQPKLQLIPITEDPEDVQGAVSNPCPSYAEVVKDASPTKPK